MEDPGRSFAELADLQERSMRDAAAPTRESWPAGSALTPDELDAVLERNWYAVLATTRPDGRPHAAPVAFVVHDRRIWMASVAGAVRLRNIAHVPFASVVVSEGQGEHHVAVMIEGRATLHEAEPVVSAWLGAAWRERFGTTPDWAGTVIELAPDRLLSFGRRISNGA